METIKRDKTIKKSLRIGKYSNPIKIKRLMHKILNGPNIVEYTLSDPALKSFLEGMQEGAYFIPSEIKLPDGEPREVYILEIEDPDGDLREIQPLSIRGCIVEHENFNQIYEIPKKINTKLIQKFYDK